ncbi:MAG: KilA-N domain-containing protein [Gammaproteobacteria bacterium]|nr:KilA-N domain-containing protein [Gammaproteobacteria bacterium]
MKLLLYKLTENYSTIIDKNELVITKRGAPSSGGGTWLHRKLAVSFARWCDMQIENILQEAAQSVASITPAQQSALHQIVARRSGEDRKIRAYFWARFNNHFKLGSYKQLPAVQFDEAAAYLETMPLKDEKPQPLPLDLHYPLESAAPPIGESGLNYYAFIGRADQGWTDPTWELLMKLRSLGFNVDGPIYSERAKIHVMTVMHDTLFGKISDMAASGHASLPYAPVYLR